MPYGRQWQKTLATTVFPNLFTEVHNSDMLSLRLYHDPDYQYCPPMGGIPMVYSLKNFKG